MSRSFAARSDTRGRRLLPVLLARLPLLTALGAFVGLTSGGCVSTRGWSGYDGDPAANEPGPPVASYPIPSTNPMGAVYVVSLGVERLAVQAGQPATFLHVRIAAENERDAATWTLEPNDQRLEAGAGAEPPTFARDSSGVGVLTLPSGARGYLDVYYPLDPNAPRASLTWQLVRGAERVVGTTEFDRSASPDATAVYYGPRHAPNVTVGLGPTFWVWPDYYASSWGAGWGVGYGVYSPYYYAPYYAPYYGPYSYGYGYRPYGYGGYGRYGYGGYPGGAGRARRYVPPRYGNVRPGTGWRAPPGPGRGSAGRSVPYGYGGGRGGGAPSRGAPSRGGGGGGGWRGRGGGGRR